MKRPRANLSRLATEKPNRTSRGLDLKTAREIASIINAEDERVAVAVRRTLPQVARAIDLIADRLRRGGRLIYVGAGTSGRLAALDAAECPPTFTRNRATVQFVMAGGVRALGAATEANEDSPALGRREMSKKNPGRNDVVVGIAASGRTPFTIAAVEYARRKGAETIAVTCNRGSPLEKAANLAIVAEVGPEVVSGSTRMKAGTAQKMILNMVSTGAMVRMGFVYGNLMVNVLPRNAKLSERAAAILEQAVPMRGREARRVLKAAGKNVPVALVMAKASASRGQAQRALRSAQGNVRRAIESIRQS